MSESRLTESEGSRGVIWVCRNREKRVELR